MSAQIANSQFSFHLPDLSYVDASLEEPNLRAEARVAPKPRGFAAWVVARVANAAARTKQRRALSELSRMTDVELTDIGLGRGDLRRMFEPAFNADLKARGRNFQ
jgi:uncharacterized protein YjiS (DUF1127 family)